MEKLSNKEAVALVISIILNSVILVCSQIVVEECSSASLINAVYVSIIAIVLTCLICLLYKKFAGLSILDISNFLGGKILQTIVGIVFIVYFLFMMVILLCKMIDCLQIVYYPMTNIIYITLLFIINAGIISNFKNNAYSKANAIFLPIAIIALIVIFIGNIKNLDLQNIYPLLGNGANNVFLSGISNLFAFTGIAYLYFLPSKLKKTDKFSKISVISISLSSIFFIISVAIILLMFNNNLSKGEIFPLYTAVRYIEFGTFFQRLDSAFLLIRIISFIGFLGIITNLCTNIFKEIAEFSDDKPIVYPFLLLVFGFTIVIKSSFNLELFQNFVFKTLFFAIAIGAGFIILILANLKKKFSN